MASIAQLVEQGTENSRITGPNLVMCRKGNGRYRSVCRAGD